MFFHVKNDDHTYSVSEDSLLDYLDLRAAGGARDFDRYGLDLGRIEHDVTAISPNQALALAEKIRANRRMGRIHAAA